MKTSADNVFTIFIYFHIKGQLDVDKGICCSVVGITLDIIFLFYLLLVSGLGVQKSSDNSDLEPTVGLSQPRYQVIPLSRVHCRRVPFRHAGQFTGIECSRCLSTGPPTGLM